MPSANIKQSLHAMADQLPEDATWKDVLYEACVRQEIAAGQEAADRGQFASEDEVKSAFAKWGVRLAPPGSRRGTQETPPWP